jgi:hypothetical protein
MTMFRRYTQILNKRKKFAITSFVLSLSFVGIQFVDNSIRLWAIFLLAILSAGLFIWSLWEGLGRDATLLVLVLPLFYTLGVGLFWFLIPATIYSQIPVIILYGLGIYALCLTANIYTVGAIRTIALVRAAKGVGFVLTLLTLFLLFDAILSLRISIVFTAVLVGLISFPLFIQCLWTGLLDKVISKNLIVYSLVFSLMVGEISTLIYFWPVSVVVGSLFLTISSYLLLGLGQAQIEERLFKQIIKEYTIVAAVVFAVMIVYTRWGG